MRNISLALLALAALSSTTPAHAATLISEDFESGFGAFTVTGQVGVNSGQNYADCCGATGSAASLANHFASFGSGNLPSGTMSTMVNFAAGDPFVLTFDYGAVGGTEQLFVTFDGVVYTYDPAATGDLDTTFTHAVIGGLVTGGGATTLSFMSAGGLNVDAFVDNIVLTRPDAAVPEPTTWVMMLLGFGALGAAMRRRKVAAFA